MAVLPADDDTGADDDADMDDDADTKLLVTGGVGDAESTIWSSWMQSPTGWIEMPIPGAWPDAEPPQTISWAPGYNWRVMGPSFLSPCHNHGRFS